LLLLALAAALLPGTGADSVAPPADGDSDVTHIFFSAGCVDCWPYVENVLLPNLQASGLAADYQVHDYTAPSERQRLADMSESIGLPRSIVDSLYAFVPTPNGNLVILGHVPAALIEAAAQSEQTPAKLVVWQPEMHGEPSEYRLWAWAGSVQTFAIDTPYSSALQQALKGSGPLPAGATSVQSLWPFVVTSALLDGINPCAFAVILLLLAFLFTLRQSRRRILQLGFIYILVIFLVYLGIGLGILRAVRLSSDPHFIANLGAWLLVALGSLNLIEYFFPKFPIKLHMPKFAAARANELIKQASLPATIGAAFLVGLCTFPCSGGIYVSVITLLNERATLGWGLVYLVLYNLLFVLPLIIILLGAGNRKTAKAWARWERTHAHRYRLIYGLGMIALAGFVLLIAN
jgi:cytochrome c biogenesis protein CcdA